MTDFTMTLDADGVATITWDVQAKSMNVMSTEAFALLDSLIDNALADAAVKGIILTSGKEGFRGRDGPERDRPDAGRRGARRFSRA